MKECAKKTVSFDGAALFREPVLLGSYEKPTQDRLGLCGERDLIYITYVDMLYVRITRNELEKPLIFLLSDDMHSPLVLSIPE